VRCLFGVHASHSGKSDGRKNLADCALDMRVSRSIPLMCAPLRVLPVPVLSQRIGQARLGRFVDLGGVVSLVCVCVCAGIARWRGGGGGGVRNRRLGNAEETNGAEMELCSAEMLLLTSSRYSTYVNRTANNHRHPYLFCPPLRKPWTQRCSATVGTFVCTNL
jgi:hypothetical protein